MRYLFVFVSTMAVICSCIRTKHSSDTAPLGPGDTIPAFSVRVCDGSILSEKDFSKGDALVAFFNTACPDCQKDLPVLQEFYEEYGDSVAMLLIAREETEESISHYWRQNNLSMPFAAQEDRSVFNLFCNSGIPKIYILSEGVIQAVLDEDKYISVEFFEIAFSLGL